MPKPEISEFFSEKLEARPFRISPIDGLKELPLIERELLAGSADLAALAFFFEDLEFIL